MRQADLDKKELIISAIGNMLVWYNFALFMPFLSILSEKFFPIENITTRSLVIFLVMSSALFFRPIGSAIFGPIGDKIGREKAISLSILLMAIPTFCMGVLPSYNQIGILSPILLIFLRILQGISMGGEYTATMVHLVEIARKEKRGFFGSFAEGGSQIGVMLSGSTLLILYYFYSDRQIYQYAWRIPFFFSIALIPFAFLHSKKKSIKITVKEKRKNVIEMLSECKKEVFCTVAITAFSSIGFYTLLTFLPYYFVREGILTLKLSAQCSVVATFFIILSTFGFGFLSDYFSRKLFLKLGMIGVCSIICIIFLGKIQCEHYLFILNAIYGFFLGMYYGSRSAFFSESFSKSVRCTGVSVSLSFAHAIFGGSSNLIMNFCTEISEIMSIFPIIIVTIIAIFAMSKIEDKTGKNLN